MTTTPNALDAAADLIRPAAVPAPVATKAHLSSYRAAVLLLASGTPIDESRHDEFTEAVTLLNITPEILVADVKSRQESDRLRAVAAARECLNRHLLRSNAEAEQFEAAVTKRRAELLDAKNKLIGEIQVSEAAAVELARVERVNPRLFG